MSSLRVARRRPSVLVVGIAASLLSQGVSCVSVPSGPAPTVPPDVTPTVSSSISPRDVPAVRLPGHADLSVRLLAPKSRAYDPSTFGPGGTSVGIELTNTSRGEMAIETLRASFTPVREGVTFPCTAAIPASNGLREPTTLRPGEAFVFHRELDCRLSLPGAYEIGVRLAFGAEAAIEAGHFSFALEARGPRVPKPHPASPGLFAMMAGDTASRPQGASDGAYAVVVALVNGSAKPLTLVGPRVLFRVTRVGSALPCMDEPVVLHPPALLAPGALHVERVPITCVMHKPGNYDIDAAVLLGDDGREAPLGRVRLSVSQDPLLFTAPRAY